MAIEPGRKSRKSPSPPTEAMYTWLTLAIYTDTVVKVSAESAIERRIAQQLGQQLLSLREQRGLSQEQVAHAAGMSRNHYQLLEIGLSDRQKNTAANPRLSTLVALAQVLDVSVTDLVVELFGSARSSSPQRSSEQQH